MVHVPDAATVYTGDILFIGGTPIVWAGPLSNWIDACDLMLGMDVDTVVPGHGPVTDKAGVTTVRDYLAFVDQRGVGATAPGSMRSMPHATSLRRSVPPRTSPDSASSGASPSTSRPCTGSSIPTTAAPTSSSSSAGWRRSSLRTDRRRNRKVVEPTAKRGRSSTATPTDSSG